MKEQLTTRQKEVLSFIQRFRELHGYVPSYREIARHFSVNVRAIYDILNALKEKGYVRHSPHKSRALEIVEEDPPPVVYLPLVGEVAAGRPLLAEEHIEGEVVVPESFLPRGGGRFFVLRVKGESMEGAGILRGDLAIIREQDWAVDGDIVVALLEENATLKRFFKEKHRIRLESSHPSYPPIYTTQVKILGKLVGIVRTYE